MNNDCVVIPGWGALIAQYTPSFYNYNNNCIEKPQRTITFNPSIDHNDGMIAHSIMRRHGVNYEKAVKIINDNVAILKQQLNQGSEVPFGRLGFFHIDENGLMEFLPFKHNNGNDDYYGLSAVEFKTIEELAREEELNVAAEKHNIKKVDFRRAMQIAASIVVLLGLTFMLSTPIVNDSRSQNYASLNVPEIKQPQQREAINWDTVNPDLAIALPHQAIADKAVQANDKQSEAKKDTNASKEKKQTKWYTALNEIGNENGRYYLIISSLNNQQQAKEFMESHSKLDTKLLEKNGKYRIYVARSDNYGKLMKIRNSMPKRYADAWICD
jgi:hypothetical protein